MRPRIFFVIFALCVAGSISAAGQTSPAPIDRTLLCVCPFIGKDLVNTQPWPALGALGNVPPDCVTTWDTITWPSWEFNITISGGPGTIDVSGTGVSCHTTPCPSFGSVQTADGAQLSTVVTASPGSAYLVVWDPTSYKKQPYFLPISSAGSSSITLVSPGAPITFSNVQYHIYYFNRVAALFDAAAQNKAKVMLVWEPTPSQYTGSSLSYCHNTGLNGVGSCMPPSDIISGTNCSTFGGGGTLVGTSDCQTKLAVADLMNFLKQTGRIGALLGIVTGNESDKCPTGVTCDASLPGTVHSNDGEWGGTVAYHAARATDICMQAKAVYGAVLCGGPGVESLTNANGFGTFGGCKQTNYGADWADAWWGTAGILPKMDFVGYHGYMGYLPQAQDYAIDQVLATCPNMYTAVQSLPMWNTEHIAGYATESSGSMVQVTGRTYSSGTCTATLASQVSSFTNPLFQQLNWIPNTDYMALVGTNTGDTQTGILITGLGTGNNQAVWSCAASPGTKTLTFAYNVTLTYGFAAESFLLQYFRKPAHKPGAIDVVNWEQWINDNSGAQGMSLCFAFNGIGYNSSSCSNLSLSAKALGEALKWVRLGGGIKPTSDFECQSLSVGMAPTTTCPFQGVMLATGVEANGTQVEVVFYSDPANHSTDPNPFPAPSWAQHYLAVDGTCTSVTGGTQVTLTHAKPIMFTSD